MNRYILSNENAIYYECGYSCDNVIYLHNKDRAFFITDGRYIYEAKESIKNKKVEIVASKDLYKTLNKLLKKQEIKKIYFNPKDFSCYEFSKINKNVKFVKSIDFSKIKRSIKSDEEIKLLKKASLKAKKAFDEFANFLNSANGLTEKELHFKAIEILTQKGKYELSFNPIFAINQNAAKPHAIPTNKRLKYNDLVLFDAGIKYKRYCSDRTVTAFFDKENGISFKREQKFKDKTIQKIYDIVLKAQEKAIKKAKVGMKASKIDKIAREVIDKAGFGKYFIHSTGHGIGLDIHELPVISPNNDTIIEENMVFTIEPGIYIKDYFGVRIEDSVAMINGRAEIL